MREIKFRQPLKVGGFHYWGYIGGKSFIGPVGDNYASVPSEQYTGRKDKNGKEIYEGDIIRCEIKYFAPPDIVGDKDETSFEEHVVKFDSGVFYVGLYEMLSDFYSIEVIGTIHDREAEK